MASTQFRIAIIGAGPGGLTLGALLHQHSIPFMLFESRAKPTEQDFATPAGSLDLHDGSGLTAIKKLELFDEFSAEIGDCTQVTKIADKDGTVLFAQEEESSSTEHGRPEIARNKLNRMLLSRIPSSAIHWGHKLVSAKRSEASGNNREVILDFGSHGKKTFDLVIGADGAWSKVRSLLTDAKPTYAGQQAITASVRNITTRYPHLAGLVGSGTLMAMGHKHGIISQRAANDTARLYTMITTSDESFATTHDLRGKSAAHAKSVVLDGATAPLGRFGPLLKELIAVAYDDETTSNPGANLEIRPMYTLYPTVEGESWEPQPGVTVLGDAAHLMPPNGEGVNMAMLDALELSEAIAGAYSATPDVVEPIRIAIDPLIETYEANMFKRAKQSARETKELLEMMYGSDNGAENLVEFFESMGQ